MTQVLISIGSNLNDPSRQVLAAMDVLEARFGTIKRSELYETEPVGLTSDQNFINAALVVNTDLSAHATLSILLDIETQAGRVRSPGSAYESRQLDLDIILYGEAILDDQIKVPHPRFRQRRFVLEPAAEIAPDMVDPLTSMSLAQLLEICPDTNEVRKVEASVIAS